MNIKKISLIVTLILVIILSGVILFSMSGEESDPTEEQPQPFDTTETILSNTPDGITENDNQNLEINETQLVDNHVDIIDSNSALISIEENDVSYEIQKDANSIHIIREHFEESSEQYYNYDYTITNLNDEYSASNQSIDSNDYTKESYLKTLIKYLEVDTFSETDNDNIEIILTDGDEINETQIPTVYGFEEINYASVILTITTDGLIQEYDVEIIGNSDGIRSVEEENYSISNIDGVDVSTPNWVSNAEDSISVIDGLYNRLDGEILLEHKGLSTIPEGHVIELRNMDTNDSYSVELPENFEEGDSLGLSYTGTDWDITVNDIPDDGESLDSNRIEITAQNGQQNYFDMIVRS